MSSPTLDITPDPKVLMALTQTPLKPLDALCELIDNGIDAFTVARARGVQLTRPVIEVRIPTVAMINKGEGVISVIDSGAGLSREELEMTLRAGYSGKNRFDSLGLFGMGFNIATGKIGRRTTVTTARSNEDFALRVTLDLPQIVGTRSFDVPVERIDKPINFDHGTRVDIDSWWPDGDANAGFAAQLARRQVNLRANLGRRYASILRRAGAESVRILVNTEPLVAHEHCVWSAERFVERRGWGNISARLEFNEVVHSQHRCLNDASIIPVETGTCLECGGSDYRSVSERIRGWVGIQRFDDNNRFGIDLIRNGRAIRISEKEAFFTYADELGESVKEYPTDQQTGRIVGEVHLDHVPVDFQKQDFQRTTEEWERAIQYLRGGSLLPSNWREDERNESPVSKLFQGYRKVRTPGRPDLYMGRWDDAAGKAVRISREVEADYYERFLAGEDGYVDDRRWWDLVETASTPPSIEMPECPECGYQNLPTAEVCDGCAHILKAKACIECEENLPVSAVSCGLCGASQVPEVQEPWRCAVCDQTNDVDADYCSNCSAVRGSKDPMSLESLHARSTAAPELSFEAQSFALPSGTTSAPVSLSVRLCGNLTAKWDGAQLPMVGFRSPGRLEVFVNRSHPAIASLGMKVEEILAMEVAHYLWLVKADQTGNLAHSVPAIAAAVLQGQWGGELARTPEAQIEALRALFDRLSDKLQVATGISSFYEDLSEGEQREFADRLITAGRLDDLSALVATGSFVKYIGPSALARHFKIAPESWFDFIWDDKLPDEGVMGFAAATAREQLVGNYLRCLEDCAAYLRYGYTDELVVARAEASRRFLEAHLV